MCLLGGGLPVEEDLHAGHLVELPVAHGAYAAEVGVPFEVQREVGCDVLGEAVVELDFEVEVGLEGAAGEPAFALEVFPGLGIFGQVAVAEAVLGAVGFAVGIGVGVELVDFVPGHAGGFLVGIEEFEAGIEVEAGEDVFLEVLGFDIATEREIDVGVVGEVFLVDTVGVAFGQERVVQHEGGLAGEEGEGDAPVGFLVFEGEGCGEVGRGEEAGNHLAFFVGQVGILAAFAELGLEVGRERGTPGGPLGEWGPGEGAGEVDLVVAFAAGLEEDVVFEVEVLPGIAIGEVGHVVPGVFGVGVLVVAEEGGGDVNLRIAGGGPVVEEELADLEGGGGGGGPFAAGENRSLLGISWEQSCNHEGCTKGNNAFHEC